MFELLIDVHEVPIEKNRLVELHRGMNKVRVSVGDHNSEPSEVFIVTGRSNGDLQTYIIFYLLEPGVHVVYGYNQNPYTDDERKGVLDEATVFVEEMGSILEEVPLATMTEDQKEAWFDGEVLYPEQPLEIIEEVEEVEDLEDVEDLDMVQIDEELAEVDHLLEAADIEQAAEVVDTGDDEVQGIVEGDDSGEDFFKVASEDEDIDDVEEEETDAASTKGAGTSDSGDVVVAEGDFDELLKQAFLKPDIVEKTRKKTGIRDDDRAPEPAPEPQPDPDSGSAPEAAETGTENTDSDENIQFDEEPEMPAKSTVTGVDEMLHDTGKESPQADNVQPDPEPEKSSGDETGLSIIRFLSKF